MARPAQSFGFEKIPCGGVLDGLVEDVLGDVRLDSREPRLGILIALSRLDHPLVILPRNAQQRVPLAFTLSFLRRLLREEPGAVFGLGSVFLNERVFALFNRVAVVLR